MRDSQGVPDTRLVEQLSEVAAAESYACGINWLFTPCVAVPQDVRWGRTFEGFSEDEQLVGSMGAAVVRGVQNNPYPMAACLKHWVGDGGTQFGTGTDGFAWAGAPGHILDQGDTQIDEAELRRRHVLPYIEGIRCGALTIMASYSSWNGVKMHTSTHMLTSVLKGELGFRGFVVSDYNAIQHCGENYLESVSACINAGVDMIMTAGGLFGDLGWKQQLEQVEAAVRRGAISAARIDDAVRRILRVKVAMGLLPNCLTRQLAESAVKRLRRAPTAKEAAQLRGCVGSAAHRELARQAVRQSLVLLKNDRAPQNLAVL